MGRAKSPAKAASSRANGAKGGRPKAYRNEYYHNGGWLAGGSSGIDDLGGEFPTRAEAAEMIQACADTEAMEEREMPETRIVPAR